MKAEAHAKIPEGGHYGPPQSGLEKPAAVGDGIQTELGCLPADWRVARFDSVFDVQQGRQVSKGNRVGENQRPFLRTKNVFWNRLDLADLDEMHFSEADESRLALKPDDLLICEGGDIGRTAIWRGLISRCYYQNHLHRARIRDPKTADAQFVLFWLWYAFEVGHLYFGRGNVTTIPNLSQSKLRELPLAIPPLAEQRKIAGVLGLVQRAIEQHERQLQLTAELKKTLLHQLFTQGLRGERQKRTEIGPVPESWEVVLFEEFALLQRGFDLPRNEFRDGPYPVVGATTTIGFHDKWNVKGPGVTVVRSGSSAGKPQFVETDFWAHNVVLFVKDFHGHNPKFVYYKIQHLDLTKYREGAAVPTLNRNSFRTIPVAVPKREEQDQFVQVLDCVEQKEEVHRRKRAALTALFHTLLHQLMTAQLRVCKLALPELA